ncbi:MAG: amino acid ABC transporter ATP-binding protein, partial [Chloroflexi bacterium]|nr:amino acid ABC transporter ATP-binding protein [Chloroflexota bacterium]
MIKLTNLHKVFNRLHVLKGINLEVRPREVICIIGRSGSGKSTMLRCINFLEEPTEGEIEIEGLRIPAGAKGREHQELVHP